MKEFRAPAARMELVSYATPYCGVLPSNETRVDFAAYHEFAGNTGVLSFCSSEIPPSRRALAQLLPRMLPGLVLSSARLISELHPR